MQPTDKILVTVACPTLDQARSIARDLVKGRLAACVQIVPGVESVYRWKGEIETGGEVLLLIKSDRSNWEALEARVRELHSYEVPEILSIPITGGSSLYLQWMEAELRATD